MKSKQLIILLIGLLLTPPILAQIGIGTVNPDQSSVLEIESNNKGFLPPRLANNTDVANPAQGLIIYNESTNCIEVNIGTPASPEWTCLNATNGGGNSNTGDFDAFPWRTSLRFEEFGLGREGYIYNGITAEKNLFMGGASDAQSGISGFNNMGTGTNGHTTTPKYMDFPAFNGKTKKVASARHSHAVLTTDNKVFLWGAITFGLLNPLNLNTPVPEEIPLVNGETGYTDITRFTAQTLFLLGSSGKAYFRGTFAATSVNEGQIAFPSGVPNSFKYTRFVGESSFSVYLEGNNGKYYAASFGHNTNFRHTGNASAPNSSLTVDIRQSSNIWEIQFPAGTGSIEKIDGRDGTVYSAIGTDGRAYGWGKVGIYVNNEAFYLFSSDDLPSPPPNSTTYRSTPILLNYPPGETSFKDIGSAGNTERTVYLGGSGKVYVISKKASNQNPEATIIIKNDGSTNPYKLLPTSEPIKKMVINGSATLLLTENNELLITGTRLSGYPGTLPDKLPAYDYLIPTPLMHGKYDYTNTNLLEPN